MQSSFAVRCSLFAVGGILAGALPGQITGTWGAPFQHPTNGVAGWPATFEVVNMAVIPNRSPTGLNANDVIIGWDLNPQDPALQPPVPVPWQQRYTVGNPEVPSSFVNRWVTIPLGPNGLFYGDLFCAGHCWLPDGRLFIAGGNAQYAGIGPGLDQTGAGGGLVGYLGSRFVGLWDPLSAHTGPDYGWDFIASGSIPNPRPMRLPRWYPTVTLISDTFVMVSGGQSDTMIATNNDPAYNTELLTFVWVPPQRSSAA